jgi:hypothetical protein
MSRYVELITADERICFTAMFKPIGMTNDLEPSTHMYADVATFRAEKNELEIIQWPGRYLDLSVGRSHYLLRRRPEVPRLD